MQAVLNFFRTWKLCSVVNCTTIILVPKVVNPENIAQFRPITCVLVVYKVISRILIARLQHVVCKVVSNAHQSSFILGRAISDNIFLATDLIRGYNRKGLSLRFMIKLDLQKAYDSMDKVFLEMCVEGDEFS